MFHSFTRLFEPSLSLVRFCAVLFPVSSIRHIERLLLGIHNIGPHRILDPADHIVARVEKVAMLENQDAPTLRDDIDFLVHPIIVERGRAAFELARGVVEIQMERKVRTLCAIRRFVAAVVVGYLMSFCRSAEADHIPLKYSPPTYFKKRILSFSRVTFQVSLRLTGPMPVTSVQSCNRWMSGTASCIRAHILATISRSSHIMRPHFRVSSYSIC